MKVEERSKLNRQSSPALQHKAANRISDPSLPPRSESFSSGGMQPPRTPPVHCPVEPQVQPHLLFNVINVSKTRCHPSTTPADPRFGCWRCSLTMVSLQMAHLVPVRSHSSSLSVSQTVHDQPSKGVSTFQENLKSHRPEMPRQNSDPTSEMPPPAPRVPSREEKFDRGSPWLRQEDLPPKVRTITAMSARSNV